MAEAWPLGRRHYLQFLRVGRDAPRSEPSWTTELDGKGRYGRGRTHRLFGPYAVVVGSWTEKSPDDVIEASAADLGADLTPEQFEMLRSRFSDHNISRLETGWVAPPWHPQRWLRRFLPLLVRVGLVNTPAYGVVVWKWPWRRRGGWNPMATMTYEQSRVWNWPRRTPKQPVGVVSLDWNDVEPRVEPR